MKNVNENVGQNANADNRDLGVMRAGGMVLGAVESVNGVGARPCLGYEATQHELLVVARHWMSEILASRTNWFLHADTSACDGWIEVYAARPKTSEAL
jgi:hypothetical protein